VTWPDILSAGIKEIHIWCFDFWVFSFLFLFILRLNLCGNANYYTYNSLLEVNVCFGEQHHLVQLTRRHPSMRSKTGTCRPQLPTCLNWMSNIIGKYNTLRISKYIYTTPPSLLSPPAPWARTPSCTRFLPATYFARTHALLLNNKLKIIYSIYHVKMPNRHLLTTYILLYTNPNVKQCFSTLTLTWAKMWCNDVANRTAMNPHCKSVSRLQKMTATAIPEYYFPSDIEN